MEDILVTALVSHPEMSKLKEPLFWNSPDMSVIADTSQSGMSVLPAGPQFAPPVEQQFLPEGTAERQCSTAVLRDSTDGNDSASAREVALINASRKRMTRMILAFEAGIAWLSFRLKCAFIIFFFLSSVQKTSLVPVRKKMLLIDREKISPQWSTVEIRTDRWTSWSSSRKLARCAVAVYLATVMRVGQRFRSTTRSASETPSIS
jgi:hypothetical protein